MQSIKQNSNFKTRLPDLRNLGILLRVLILVNVLALMAAILKENTVNGIITTFIQLSTAILPILIMSLLSIYSIYPFLRRLQYWLGVTISMCIVIFFASLVFWLGQQVLQLDFEASLMRSWLLAVLFTGVCFAYFHQRDRALSPAVTEARLQALQARIRPHFLFNCINAVLSIIRTNPKGAESALEDMSDLFRVLMADNRELVPLSQELALCRQYLALEKLRLDERLQIVWQVDEAANNALVPPLVLQPLLENAVYHGIEPLSEGGTVSVHILAKRNEIHIQLMNPYTPETSHHKGNKMALGNIKERLALHFDAEARLSSKVIDHQYQVDILIPQRTL